MPITDIYATTTFLSAKGNTNNTTAVEIVEDPGAGSNSFIIDKESLGILNRDTVAATIIVTITGGTPQIIEEATLSPGDRWTNSTKIVIGAGETLTVELADTITANQLTWQVSYYQITN